MNNVKDFGAVGDGITVDTKAIQAAINAGGIAFFPPGTYVCGTIFLHDNGGLELSPGAVLLASGRMEDYNADDFAPFNKIYETEAVSGAHLIIADNAKNIVIRGGGRIDGNRPAFYELPEDIVCSYETITWRPAQMIFLHQCENVIVSDIQLTNSPYWSLFLYDCTHVQVHGVRINNPMHTPNGDGLDLEACKYVTVSDCRIETGDDCIAIRSSSDFGQENPIAENITITNCILTTVCNAVRIGIGNGIVRNITMDNCQILGSRTGFCIATQYWKDSSLQIENCMFCNLYIEAKRPFSLHSNAWGRSSGPVKSHMENLLFCNIRGTVSAANLIDAFDFGDIRNIEFDNVMLTASEVAPEAVFYDDDFDYTERTNLVPRAFWLVRNADNISFNRCFIRKTAPLVDFTRIVALKNSTVLGNVEEVR